MDTTIEPFDFWLARRQAAFYYRKALNRLRRALNADVPGEIIRECRRQAASYRATWSMARKEYRTAAYE